MHLTISKDLTVDSRLVAEGCGVEHESALRLLETHRDAIEGELGVIRFEIGVKTGAQRGKLPRFACLTEDQATALVTMFRNTAVVVKFKVALAKAFGIAKQRLSEASQKRPSYGDVLDLANFYREKSELLGDLMGDILPANLHLYGTTDAAGRVYNGIRRASITRSISRLREASAFHVKVCQLEMQELLESGAALPA